MDMMLKLGTAEHFAEHFSTLAPPTISFTVCSDECAFPTRVSPAEVKRTVHLIIIPSKYTGQLTSNVGSSPVARRDVRFSGRELQDL